MTAPLKRRTVVRTLLALVAVVGLSTGCVGQRTPGGYGDSVEENFVDGCTETSGDGATLSDGTDFEPGAFCQCAYDELSKDGGVSFDEFKNVVDDQIDDPGPLPESFTSAYATCSTDTTRTTETTGTSSTETTGG